tara:strand:+ start:607 stop:873 length:267 start_codon:yes stop_codon:yes gene_type:complete
MKKNINIPKFNNENKERDFWTNISLDEYFSAADFESVSFPNLKPSSRPISLRIPEYLFVRIKEQANELHIPYQSLIKKYIAQGISKKL